MGRFNLTSLLKGGKGGHYAFYRDVESKSYDELYMSDPLRCGNTTILYVRPYNLLVSTFRNSYFVINTLYHYIR